LLEEEEELELHREVVEELEVLVEEVLVHLSLHQEQEHQEPQILVEEEEQEIVLVVRE
jgi:hypothetical protein